MATNRDESELTFEGMTARVGRFLTRVYRFPRDWGVLEPKAPDPQNNRIRRRLEELRIYGCSPVPDWMKRKREKSAEGAVSSRAQCGKDLRSADTGPSSSPLTRGPGPALHNSVLQGIRDDKDGGSPPPHEQREGADAPSGTRGNSAEHFFPKRPRLFRYDAKRLKRMIASAEHMIRCLIIWRAYRAMRDEKIPARFHPIPSPPPAGTPRRPQPSIHPHFAVRGLPLYEPRAPAFRISMPLDIKSPSPGQERGWGEVDGTPPHPKSLSPMKGARDFRRPRNDELSTHERLYLRLERLDQLYEEVDKRGRRLAARWADQIHGRDQGSPLPHEQSEGAGDPSGTRGNITEQTERLTSEPDRATGESPPHLSPGSPHPHEQSDGADALSRRRRTASSIRPLKSHDPPPDLLENADEDEAEDLHILHDVAIRTAEDFESLCG